MLRTPQVWKVTFLPDVKFVLTVDGQSAAKFSFWDLWTLKCNCRHLRCQNHVFFSNSLLTVKGSKMGYFSQVRPNYFLITPRFQPSTVRIPPLTVRVFLHNNLFSTLCSISENLYIFYSSFYTSKWKIFNPLHGFRCVSLAFSKKKRFFQPFMLEICGILTLAKKAWLASGKPNHICGVLYGVVFHLYSL